MTREDFIKKVVRLNLTRAGQAIALLWFYREEQLFEERTASELAEDLNIEGLVRPNVTELKKVLTKNRKTVRGKRSNTFKINVRYLDELNETFGSLLKLKEVPVTSSVLPFDLVKGTRFYIEKIVVQINGSYDYGFYDACATLLRRFMESLIIEVFIHNNITDEVRVDRKFVELGSLIKKICEQEDIHLGRGSNKIMLAVKILGDTAAHDRTYITQKQDIDDIKQGARRLIQELLTLSGVIK